MTEASQVNGAIGRHLGPLGHVRRVEHKLAVGWPDWYYRVRGVAGWIEAKLLTAGARCPVSRDQVMWGEAEAAAGGLWHCLGLLERPGREWVLLDVRSARAYLDGAPLRASGAAFLGAAFPTTELVRALVPADRRQPQPRES